jgi:hypothetical protein
LRPGVDPLQRVERRIGLLRAPEGVRGGRVWGSPGLQGRAGLAADCLPRATRTRPKSRARWGKACPIDGVARGSSPPPSAALATCKQAPALEGSADRAARSPVKMCARAPRDLGAVFPDGCPVRAARHRCRASSPGVVQRTPLHREGRGVHSRRRHRCPRLRDAATSRILVPPSWFLTTSTACSSSTVRACCIPLPILGFTAFPPRRPTSGFPDAARRAFPAMLSCPPKPSSPPAARARVTARTVADACVHRAPLPS